MLQVEFFLKKIAFLLLSKSLVLSLCKVEFKSCEMLKNKLPFLKNLSSLLIYFNYLCVS